MNLITFEDDPATFTKVLKTQFQKVLNELEEDIDLESKSNTDLDELYSLVESIFIDKDNKLKTIDFDGMYKRFNDEGIIYVLQVDFEPPGVTICFHIQDYDHCMPTMIFSENTGKGLPLKEKCLTCTRFMETTVPVTEDNFYDFYKYRFSKDTNRGE